MYATAKTDAGQPVFLRHDTNARDTAVRVAIMAGAGKKLFYELLDAFMQKRAPQWKNRRMVVSVWLNKSDPAIPRKS